MLRHLLLALLILGPIEAWADGPPLRLPCEGSPKPAYAPVGKPPALGEWGESELRRAGWQVPSCLPRGDGRTRMVTVLAAELPFAGTLDDLLARFAALSHYPTIRYWSVLNQDWQDLVFAAGMLDGPDGRITRPDPAGADFVTGRDFYYFEVDHTGRSVHRLTVNERSEERAILSNENLTPIRFSMLTLFQPGALQSAMFIEKRGPGVWGLYQMIRIGAGADFVAVNSTSPYLNRLTALYRYLAGIPTDLEPPAAPR